MNRRYTKEQYLMLTEKIRRAVPDISLTTDIIVGFPGETEEEFVQSLDFIQRCAFSSMHIFPYSKRPGTPAAQMPDPVSRAEKQVWFELCGVRPRNTSSTFLRWIPPGRRGEVYPTFLFLLVSLCSTLYSSTLPKVNS